MDRTRLDTHVRDDHLECTREPRDARATIPPRGGMDIRVRGIGKTRFYVLREPSSAMISAWRRSLVSERMDDHGASPRHSIRQSRTPFSPPGDDPLAICADSWQPVVAGGFGCFIVPECDG